MRAKGAATFNSSDQQSAGHRPLANLIEQEWLVLTA
jgi:hypothetical protein